MGWIILLILIFMLLLLVLYVNITYNKLVKLKNMVKNAWAQIDVQLKRRADLIPNIVETLKGYATHESETFEKVIVARNIVINTTDIDGMLGANKQLTKALKMLFAVSEAYPELKANTHFLQLQKELSETEDKIMFSRQFYNDTVTKFNIAIQQFPALLVAKMCRFVKQTLFEVVEPERAVPKIET